MSSWQTDFRPHEQEPFLVGRQGMSLHRLFVEPPMESPHWLSSTFARSLAISRGVVWTYDDADNDDHVKRAREAGFRRLESCKPDETRAQRCEDWPLWGDLSRLCMGMGSLEPRLVIVDEYMPTQRPFWGRAWGHMMRALRLLGWDELQVYWTTSMGTRRIADAGRLQGLQSLLARNQPSYLVMGRRAQKLAKAAGIEHIAIQHPSWHQKYRAKEGVAGYATRLHEAGLPQRVFIEGPPGDDCRTPLADAMDVPSDVAFRRMQTGEGAAQNDRSIRRVPPQVADAARRAYVLGDVKNLKEAAALVEANYSAICEEARANGWDAERENHITRVREEAYREAARAEGKAIAASRKLAWGSAVKALQTVHSNLQNGIHKPTTGDCQRLVDVACKLSELGDADMEAEEMRLASATMAQVRDELTGTLKDQFGIEVPDDESKETQSDGRQEEEARSS